MLLKDKPEY